MSSLKFNSFGIKKKNIKKDPRHHHYEYGAHFKYQDLYSSLVNLYYSLPKERQGIMINDDFHDGKALENISNNYLNIVPRYVKSVKENSRYFSKANLLNNKGKSCESNHKFFPFSKNKKMIEYRNFLKIIQNIKYKISDKSTKKNSSNENINFNKLNLNNTVNKITELNPNKIILFNSLNNNTIDGPILSTKIKKNKNLNYKFHNFDYNGISSFYNYRRPKLNIFSSKNPQIDRRENFK
jgi:hypothetical protein